MLSKIKILQMLSNIAKKIALMTTSTKPKPPAVYLQASAMLSQTLDAGGKEPPTEAKVLPFILLYLTYT